MAELISVPLKKPSEVDVENPLKNLIQSRYSTADKPEDCSEAIAEFAKLRNNAIWRVFEKYESSLEIIYRYESCLDCGKLFRKTVWAGITTSWWLWRPKYPRRSCRCPLSGRMRSIGGPSSGGGSVLVSFKVLPVKGGNDSLFGNYSDCLAGI